MKETTCVDEAADFIRGITFKPDQLVEVDDEDAIVCMRTKNVQKELDETDLIAVPRSIIKNQDKFLREGDILISSANSWDLVGKCSYVWKLGYTATAGGFIGIVRPKAGKTHPRFFYHWLNSAPTQHLVRNLGRQTTNISNLDVNRFKELQFLKLNYAEQERIAAVLDKADGIRRKRNIVFSSIENFMKSEFVARFGTPMSNSNHIPTAPIKMLGKVVTGNTPPRKDPKNYGDGIEWIKSDNINTPSHFLTQANEHLSTDGKQIGRVVPAGSTLVTCIAGSPSVIGNAALADREVAFNQQINAVIPNEQTDPFFLYCQIIVAKPLIQSSSTNSMKGMVSKGKFQEIEFLQPSHDEQVEFGKFFSRTIAVSKRLHADWDASEQLFSALIQRAFRGEL